MKKLSLAAIAAMSFFVPGLPVYAGLGEAASKSTSSTYDAWCGEKGNECEVSFVGGRITVNQTSSVDFKDITYITNHMKPNFWAATWVFGVEYQEDGMESPEFAEFLFMDMDAARRFWRDLKRACRQCKDRDAAQVDVNINN